MHEEGKKNIVFTTPWGMFMYDKMTPSLMNNGAMLQRAMDITFVGKKDKFIVIYLDGVTVFSKSDEKHLDHLRQVFLKCKKIGISLNPKKSFFSMQ